MICKKAVRKGSLFFEPLWFKRAAGKSYCGAQLPAKIFRFRWVTPNPASPMKKFIITFEFQRLQFSAKLHVIRKDKLMIYRMRLLQSDFAYELNGITLNFV